MFSRNAFETCEIAGSLREISKDLMKFHRIVVQEKCKILFCFREISQSVMKFRRIFAMEVCKILKGEINLHQKA